MADEQTTTATPPAALGGIDSKALSDAVAAAVSTALATALPTAVAEAMKSVAPAAAPAARPEGGEKPLTLADVKGLLADQQKAAAKNAARDRYAAEQLKDIPAAYRNQLPDTDDAAALERAGQAARAQYRADLAANGFKAPDVGGNPPPNGTPAARAPVDLSKMNSTELIEMGLKQAGPPRPGAAAPAAATTTGANAAA